MGWVYRGRLRLSSPTVLGRLLKTPRVSYGIKWAADARIAYTQTWLARIFSASSVAGPSPDPFDVKAASPVTMATQSSVGKRSAFRSQKAIEVLNSSAWTWSMSIPWSAEPTTLACQSWWLSYFLPGSRAPSRRMQVNVTVQRKVFLLVAMDGGIDHWRRQNRVGRVHYSPGGEQRHSMTLLSLQLAHPSLQRQGKEEGAGVIQIASRCTTISAHWGPRGCNITDIAVGSPRPSVAVDLCAK